MKMCYNVGVRRDSLAERNERNREMKIIRDLVSGAVNAMSDRYEYDADAVAEILGIDGEAFAWCDGGDCEFALAQFDSCTERDTWLNQI